MTNDELLKSLRELEVQLRSSRVQFFFQNQPPEAGERFVTMRQEVSALIGQLVNAQLGKIADQLDSLSNDLNLGIQNLQKRIEAFNTANDILNDLAKVIRVAVRIVDLVA